MGEARGRRTRKVTSVVTPDVYGLLERYAEADRRSVSDAVRVLIEDRVGEWAERRDMEEGEAMADDAFWDVQEDAMADDGFREEGS